MSEPQFSILRGSCVCYLAYDIGREVKLDLAEKRIQERVRRPQLSSDRRQPRYFGYDPLPVRFSRKVSSVPVAGYMSDGEVECTVWDFGALTIAFKIQLPPGTPLVGLIELSAYIDETDVLEREANALVYQIVNDLGNAIKSRHVNDIVEDYVVFRISEVSDHLSGSALREKHRSEIAQIVRCERVRLAENIVVETLRYRVSYKAVGHTKEDADLTVIGWNGALIYGQDEETAGDDLSAVFEFVLTYLLEMRLLDEKLDDYLDEAYSVSIRRSRFFHADFSRIGLIQIDAATLFEAVHNALKLVGDQFPAEVQAVAAARFGFEELDRTIRRKLGTLQEIYEKLADRRSHRRSETLEVIIICLFFFDIAIQFIF